MSNPVLVAIAEVEATRRRLTLLSKEKPEGWKKEYANARPLLQDQLASLAGVGKEWLRKHGDSVASAQFADLVNNAEAKVIRHQARWPVIVIDSANTDYLSSVREIDQNFAEIVAFIRSSVRS